MGLFAEEFLAVIGLIQDTPTAGSIYVVKRVRTIR
jgi:hypothetical protein